MKKSSIHSLLLASLTALSVACYLVLQVEASANETAAAKNESALVEKAEESSVSMPDFTLVKRIFNITKIVLPKD